MKRYKNTRYLITEDGKVWGEHRKRFLKPNIQRGYSIVGICTNGIEIKKLVHRLVAETYISNPNNYPHVNHINNDRSDNRVENLEWCTNNMNVIHKVNQNRQARGVKLNQSDLTEIDVIEIRRLYTIGDTSHRKLAKLFNVSHMTISYIVRRKGWKHI